MKSVTKQDGVDCLFTHKIADSSKWRYKLDASYTVHVRNQRRLALPGFHGGRA
jgi:hypothetical protein